MSEEKAANISQNQLNNLLATVEMLKAKNAVAEKPRFSRYTQHSREHTALMRHYKDEKVSGLVTEVSNVIEIRDPDQAKRLVSRCDIKIFNPATEKETQKTVPYLDFLQKTPQIRVKIVDRKVTQEVRQKRGTRYESYTREGQIDERVGDHDFIFEELIEHIEYALEVEEGEFKGAKFTHDGKGLNV